MNLRTFYKLVKDGRYGEYQRSIRDSFWHENAHLFTGTVLDAGCGHSIFHRIESDRCRYIGLDLSLSELLKNGQADFRICADVGCFPLRDSTVNLIICKDLVEHLYQPEELFEEASRCLIQGGAFIISTPNLYGGTSLVAKFLPHTLFKFIWKIWRKSNIPSYPFVYKANTSRALHRLASDNRLVVESISYINSVPQCFRSIPILATVSYAYGQFVSKVRADFLQVGAMSVLRKHGA